jgi:hypothetical protein
MITLHEFGPAFTLRTASPFGFKLEACINITAALWATEQPQPIRTATERERSAAITP